MLGGGVEMKESGKKAVSGNINTKPSKHADMYEYVEGFHDLVKKHSQDYPKFISD
jgi:hypothetical protein